MVKIPNVKILTFGDFSVLLGLTQPTAFPTPLTAKLGEGKGCGLLVSIGNLSWLNLTCWHCSPSLTAFHPHLFLGLLHLRLGFLQEFGVWIGIFTFGIFTFRIFTFGIFTFGIFTFGIFTFRIFTFGIVSFGKSLWRRHDIDRSTKFSQWINYFWTKKKVFRSYHFALMPILSRSVERTWANFQRPQWKRW